MLSAVKNFLITFVSSVLIFGTIAYFAANAVENGISGIGIETDDVSDIGEGSGIIGPDFEYVTDENGDAVTDADGAPVTQRKEAEPVVDDIKGKSFNMLLIGLDYQSDVLHDYDLSEEFENISGFKPKERRINADTIILVRVDKEKQSFVFLPISSNTQVYISGVSMTIGSLYDKYGLDFLCQKVRALTGLDIDYYISMSIPNLSKVIELVGGISYMVPVDMKYKDESQSLNIDLKKGQQTLSGDQALQMLRYCSYSDGNLSRMALGVGFVKSLADKFTAASYRGKAVNVLASISGYADTDFTADALVSNLDLIFSYSSFTKTDFTYPGVSKTENDVFYFVPSYSEAIKSLRVYR